MILYEEANPAFGAYNMTFTSPIESAPGGMIFYVQAVDLENGSTYTNPNYNSIRLILDGNSPLVLSATPMDGEERHAGAAGVGQAVSIVVQDSVDPPRQLNLHYWVGCKASEAIGCTDYNFDGLPNEDEYEVKTLSSPETRAGGLNIFEGLIDDSMLLHKQRVSFYVSGEDEQNNEIAMGRGRSVPLPPSRAVIVVGEVVPDWDADLVTYYIRQEFEPEVDLGNSSILGHDDYEPLHPGVPYTAQIKLVDINGWQDIQYVQVALGGDFDDDDSSMFISLAEGADGHPVAVMTSGSDNTPSPTSIQPSASRKATNRWSSSRRFQLTWMFPEAYDTDGESHFLPKVRVTDMPLQRQRGSRLVLKLRRVSAMIGGASTTISDLTRNPERFEPLSCETARITTTKKTSKPSLEQVKPCGSLVVSCSQKTKPLHRPVRLMWCSVISKTTGAPPPVMTVNSASTFLFRRFARAGSTCA